MHEAIRDIVKAMKALARYLDNASIDSIEACIPVVLPH
jgi:hypothetical protein